MTELYDLFRLVYAKIATPCCPVCSREIRMWDPSQFIAELLEHYPGEKALVIFRTEEETEALKKRGFYRIWRDGEVKDLDAFLRESPHRLPEASFDIVLDRMIIKEGPRLADSIEMAWREGQGKIQVIIVGEEGLITLFFPHRTPAIPVISRSPLRIPCSSHSTILLVHALNARASGIS